MLKFSTILCTVVFLAGCGPSVTKVSHRTRSTDKDVVVECICPVRDCPACNCPACDCPVAKKSQDKKFIVGYGYSNNIKVATGAAWEDARKKLEISGLEDYYGLAEKETEWSNNVLATIHFELVPLKNINSDVHH